jgi:hypothetical protein
MVDFGSPDLADPVQSGLVGESASEGIRGIRRVDDDGSTGDALRSLRNQAVLRIVTVDDEAALHA